MIQLSPDAVLDVERLHGFLDREDHDATQRALARIWMAIERLQEFPALGMRTGDSDVRQIVVRFGASSGMAMNRGARACWKLAALLMSGFCLVTSPCLAADDDQAAPKGAAVTVLKATRHCFDATVEVSGILIPKDETMVRPDRPGLKVAEVLVDAGETVTAGQPLARLTAPEGGTIVIQAPVGGLVSNSSAVTGAIASAKGEPLFGIISRSEFDLVGLAPARDLPRLAVNQPATIKIAGAGEAAGKVRRVAATVEPNTQLGQVFVALSSSRRLLVNSSGRAIIKTGQSCGVSVPLTAILYGSAGTVVQVVRRDRVETRRVETGLLSGGEVEIREGLAEGDIVVARAGALLREGDPVRPVNAN